MKRIVIYIALLTASLLIPIRRVDVGELQPVGVIQLYKEGEMVVISTDTGDAGVGATVQEAFRNLKETTPGVIFLDTADYLMIELNAIEEAKVLDAYLKPSVRVCLTQGIVDPVEAAEYLPAHRPAVKLRDRESLMLAQVLTEENGRLILR